MSGKKINCNHCQKLFSTRQSLSVHMKSHAKQVSIKDEETPLGKRSRCATPVKFEELSTGAQLLEDNLPKMIKAYIENNLHDLEKITSSFLEVSENRKEEVREHGGQLLEVILGSYGSEREDANAVEDYLKGKCGDFIVRMTKVNRPEPRSAMASSSVSYYERDSFEDFCETSAEEIQEVIRECEAKAAFLKYHLKKRERTLEVKVLEYLVSYRYRSELALKNQSSQPLF